MSTTVATDSSHSLYVKSIIDLMGSMVIKSQYTAEAVNETLKEGTSYVIPTDMKQWKYYKNLNGEYHETDTAMTVVSIDTLETIVFSKDILSYHKTTAYEYQYGSVYYEELVRRYPDQETLIKGILNPVDKVTAIDAPEGTILYYNRDGVETAEVSLIDNLQEWIYNFIYRWVNPGYVIVDDLYWPDCLGRMYSFIPGVIYNLRLDKTKTDEAHSFHIWSHLASHGRMDLYKEYLTDKQRLFLYRNIEQLMIDAGTTETLDTLIQKFLTEMNIPTYTYRMVHELDKLTENYKPTVYWERVPLNTPIASDNPILLTTDELLQKESELARDNEASKYDDNLEIERLSANSKFDVLPTKIIETGVLDGAESNAVTETTMLLNNWVHWSSIGYYNGTVQIDNPFSGELIQITPRDSFNLYFFLWCLANGADLSKDKIYKYTAFDVLRTTDKPTVEWSKLFTDNKLIKQTDVNQVLSVQPVIKAVTNLRDFQAQSLSVLTCYDKCHMLSERHENLQYQMNMLTYTRGYFKDVTCTMDSIGETYEEMLFRIGVDVTNLEQDDLTILMNNVLIASVGDILTDANNLVSIQSAMVDIVRQLSSYTLQFINQQASVPSSNLPFYGHRHYDEDIQVNYDLWDGVNIDMANVALDMESVSTGVTVELTGVLENDLTTSAHLFLTGDLNMDLFGFYSTGFAEGTPVDSLTFTDQFIQEQ